MLIDEDESWFLRFMCPSTSAWTLPGERVKFIRLHIPRNTPNKAISCFGGLRQDNNQLFLDFAVGYPNSEQMWAFVIKLLAQARQENKRVLVLIWDNAPWHTSKRIKQWIRAYNLVAKTQGEPRLIVHWLPVKSPWLNPVEPHWLHAKRQVCEPSGMLSVEELKRRICAYFKVEPFERSYQL